MAGRQPTQAAIMLPLLHELYDAGGVAKPGELYDRIAARMDLDAETRSETVVAGKAGAIRALSGPSLTQVAVCSTLDQRAGQRRTLTNFCFTLTGEPTGMAVDALGNVYVVDREFDLIRKITP
jgi:hypothetical protein